MNTLNRTLSTIALTATTVSLPMLAHANTYSSQGYNSAAYGYEACKKRDSDNQVIGGLIGAIAGGVIGSQVSGNGARTEGSVLGAVIGGGIGAAIGDDTRNCRKETGYVKTGTTTYYPTTTSRSYGTTTSYPVSSTRTYGTTASYPVTTSRTYGTTTASYPSTYGNTYGTTTYTTRTHYPTTTSRVYTGRTYGTPSPVYNSGYHGSRYVPPHYNRRAERLNRINYRIDAQRTELRRLESKLAYRDGPRLRQRIADAEYELKRLRKRKRQIKRNAYR